MQSLSTKSVTPGGSRRHWLFFFAGLGFALPAFGILVYLVYETNSFLAYDSGAPEDSTLEQRQAPLPFPIGVDPREKSIAEQPRVEEFLTQELSRTTDTEAPIKVSFVRKAIAKLALLDWYQSLAAGASRVLIIQPGERKEQVAANFAKILKWNDEEKKEFVASILSSDPVLLEGKFFPGSYIVAQGAKPGDVTPLIIERFDSEILTRYPADITRKVALNDALTIASLLEREAYDFDDMRHIAGVIWNRLFIGMNLQIDASLQYAKGTTSSKTWWPKVVPNDKYIDSPYNTYKHEGLPPAPIANPSVDAILAALNPRETECMYYFHDKHGEFHCTKTYAEHVALLKEYYGRGK